MDKKQTVKGLIHKLGLKYRLSDEIIKQIVESPYEFAFEVLKELKLEEVKTEEELNNLKTNFNFKALGKLYMSYPILERRLKQINHINDLNKRQWKK